MTEEFWEEIKDIPAEDLIFVDEAGVNRAMAVLYGWSLCGQRAEDIKPADKGPNVTMIGALGLSGMIAMMTIVGSANTTVFVTFLRECLLPEMRKGQVLVLDNVRFHRSALVAQVCEEKGVRVVYLPPYSPELNPIEEGWSKIKGWLRGVAARTAEALDSAISTVVGLITPGDANGWFRHAGYIQP